MNFKTRFTPLVNLDKQDTLLKYLVMLSLIKLDRKNV